MRCRFGAGFPSIPLKIAFPELQITIVDSLNKRITFLSELTRLLGIDASLYHDRAETFGQNPHFRASFDLVTARAVARLNVLAELCLPLAKQEGYFYALKAAKSEEELTEAKQAIALLGGKFLKEEAVTLPNVSDQRHIIVIQKRNQPQRNTQESPDCLISSQSNRRRRDGTNNICCEPKGGVGKTTTTVNLGACLASLGKKVLLVDMDAQGNATSGVGIRKPDVTRDIYDVLVNELPIDEATLITEHENLSLPATLQLAGAEIELTSMMARESRLKGSLAEVSSQYDYILIDCPPSLGHLTINSFTASDSILIPVQCEYYALEGLSQLLNTVRLVQKHFNPELEIEGVLLTMYDARTNLGNEVVEEVRKYFREKVYETIIPRNIRLSEAPSHGKPIIDYDPRSRGAEVYQALAKEVVSREEK